MSSWSEIILLFPAGTGKSLTFFYNVRDEVLQIRNGLNADPGLAINLNGDPDPVPGPGFCHPADKNIYEFYFLTSNFYCFFIFYCVADPDTGWKNSDPRPGIHIPDPQH